jgi:hypothetical protein
MVPNPGTSAERAVISDIGPGKSFKVPPFAGGYSADCRIPTHKGEVTGFYLNDE